MRKKLSIHQRADRGRWALPKNSNVRRYFNALIDFLLAPYPVLPGEINGLESTYVKIPDVEKELFEIFRYSQSNFWQLVGYKGTGKTSVIRGGLGLWNESSGNKITDNTLVVYCSFNGTDLYSDEKDEAVHCVIEGVLGAALEMVRVEHLKRRGKKLSAHDLFDFINKSKPDVLYRFPIATEEKDIKVARLRAWECANRITYRAAQLKYEFSMLPLAEENREKNDEVFLRKQILFIMDDIEGMVRQESRIALAKIISPLWTCLRNGVDYPAKLLIAHRPHTRDEFMRNQTWTPITIEYSSSLTLKTLLQKRAEKFLEHSSEGRELCARHTWVESYAALWSLLTRYSSGDNHEIILALSNYCFRDSLVRLTNLIQHTPTDKPQLSYTDNGGFNLSNVEKFLPNISRADLIELIGFRGYQFFAPDEKVGIVNILENDAADEGTDFSILFLIHWAWHHTEHYSKSWPRLIDIATFVKYLETFIPTHPMIGSVSWATKRSEDLGLLDAVIDQFDPGRILHHLMPRADIIYQELENSSALLGLGLHECYMSDEEIIEFQADRHINFMLAVKFCGKLIKFERAILDACLDKKSYWDKVLCQKTLSQHVYAGLEKTWGRWSSGDKPSGGGNELQQIKKEINKLEADYGKK